ncbi:hypothetical protein CRE_05964 [Caenorhabditis remanei]|uniref:Uncharacterized protein n=1 Tax=Caenorhabditis remanei TaxID=31234 RepID=E3MZA4_CAERE|nr:hypothetical protein CRE_05964 [Caenorhabditis remanei]
MIAKIKFCLSRLLQCTKRASGMMRYLNFCSNSAKSKLVINRSHALIFSSRSCASSIESGACRGLMMSATTIIENKLFLKKLHPASKKKQRFGCEKMRNRRIAYESPPNRSDRPYSIFLRENFVQLRKKSNDSGVRSNGSGLEPSLQTIWSNDFCKYLI